MAKTRETVIDGPPSILREVMEVVENYKYPGVHIDSRLSLKTNTEAGGKKGVSRLYVLS